MIQAPKTDCLIAVSQHCWGRGTTDLEAQKRLREAGGSTRDKWFLIHVTGDSTAEINQLGNIMLEHGAEWHVIGGSKGWEQHPRARQDRATEE